MATITREYRIETPLDEVWKKLSDVGAVNELIDFIGDVEVDGNWRTCAISGDGGALRELLVTVDDDAHRLVYSIRTSPFDLEHHSASWELTEEDGATRFVWISDFAPDEAAPALEQAVDAAAASMLRVLG